MLADLPVAKDDDALGELGDVVLMRDQHDRQASVVQVHSIDELPSEEIVRRFTDARSQDYETLLAELKKLGRIRDGAAPLARLRRRLDHQLPEPVQHLLQITGDWQRFNGLPGAEGTLQRAEPKPDKEIEFDAGPVVRFNYKPNLRVLGPKLGKELTVVREALSRNEFERLDDGRIRVSGHDLSPEDELIAEPVQQPGWVQGERLAVGIETKLDEELRLEGRVLDLIHHVNTKRKEAGLELTDRIELKLPESDADLLAHEQWIKDEVLAVEIHTDGVAEPQIAKV